ncbi:spermatogenesis-associated protein 1-like [Watersipora subatra]|uniref:spermatogenesis-associated protein 1-like n=1 Tax=Watersipora subatra TaxID=2589382 RepID=UPI00355AF0F6
MNGSLDVPRPTSEQVRDLHVYVIPPELWRQHLRSAANEVITDSISLGFLRIPPHIYLQELRQEIVAQLGDDGLPKDYAFLKSVGRCLTQVKSRQERELKVKHFLPPYAYAPELYILDAHAESMRDSPSTIYQKSLSGAALLKSDSKVDSLGYQSGKRTSSKYPPSRHETTNLTYRVNRQSEEFRSGDGSQYISQVSDKPSYPSYSHPYSHDISALTNAHRNQIDPSHSYDSISSKGGDFYNPRKPNAYNSGGGNTYRKRNDDSSGYQSIPSPVKGSDSHHDNPRPDKNLSSPDHRNRGSPSHNYSRSHPDDRADSPHHHGSHSPHKIQRGDSASRHRHRNGSYSPQRSGRKDGSNSGSSEPTLVDDPKRIVAAGQTNSELDSNQRKQDENREMMSATPTSAPVRHQLANAYGEQLDLDDPSAGHEDSKGSHGHREETVNSKLSAAERTDETKSREKDELMRQLQQARDARLASEKKREELVKKARAMQAKTNNRRNQAREVWKKKYYEAKKQTPGLEADCLKLRTNLDSLHRKHLAALENLPPDDKQKENYQLEAVKLQYEVDDLQRKSDAAKMKLTAEMKLRNQAETELRALRAELTQKKMNMNLSRAQKINSLGNSVLSVSSQP